MGGDPLHFPDAGILPPQGGVPSDRQATSEMTLSRLLVPPIGGAIREAVLEDLEVYTPRRHNMFTQYITTHLIMGIYGEAERWTGLQVSKLWWEQKLLSLEEAQVTTMVADKEDTEEVWEADD